MTLNTEVAPRNRAVPRRGTTLQANQLKLIQRADTLFVASGHASVGLDVSHRGGPAGFVETNSANRLRIPDNSGNGMFNTLGNFELNANAGLTFLDFQRNRLLQLSGKATILWRDAVDNEPEGIERYWEFELECWRESEISMGLSWEFLDESPYLLVYD